MVICE
jgi:hypothetical protein